MSHAPTHKRTHTYTNTLSDLSAVVSPTITLICPLHKDADVRSVTFACQRGRRRERLLFISNREGLLLLVTGHAAFSGHVRHLHSFAYTPETEELRLKIVEKLCLCLFLFTQCFSWWRWYTIKCRLFIDFCSLFPVITVNHSKQITRFYKFEHRW